LAQALGHRNLDAHVDRGGAGAEYGHHAKAWFARTRFLRVSNITRRLKRPSTASLDACMPRFSTRLNPSREVLGEADDKVWLSAPNHRVNST
jgi:hypothetical protein